MRIAAARNFSAISSFKDKQLIHLVKLRDYLQEIIAQYNTKSKMIPKKNWKNLNLPYQIKYKGFVENKLEFEYVY